MNRGYGAPFSMRLSVRVYGVAVPAGGGADAAAAAGTGVALGAARMVA